MSPNRLDETRSPQSTISAAAPQVPLPRLDEPVYEWPVKDSNTPTVIRWAFVLRGLAGIFIGIWTFVSAEAKLDSTDRDASNLFVLFAAYAFVGSSCALIAAWKTWSEQKIGWLLLLDAGFGLVWGVLLLGKDWLLPLPLGLAAWPITTGVFQTAAAFQSPKFLTSQWLLTLAGVISLLYGLALPVVVVLLSRPYLTVGNLLNIFWVIAAYEVISGVLLAIFGFAVRARHENRQPV